MDNGDRSPCDDDETVEEALRSREVSDGQGGNGTDGEGDVRGNDERAKRGDSKGEGRDDGQHHDPDRCHSQEVDPERSKGKNADECIHHDQYDGAAPDETTGRSGRTDENTVSEDVNGRKGIRGATPSQERDRAESVTTDTDRKRPNSGDSDRKSLLRRFRNDNEGPMMWVREMLSSALIVLVLGLLLFAVSGVWPPMVAVESGSMEPNMDVGDLVFVTEPGRFAPDAAENDIGVVTYEDGQGADYRTFSTYGSVIIFQPPGRTASPIIHRAMFYVEEGENWYDRADDRYHDADGCDQLRNCPAPHDGFVTLGDNNGQYDQVSGLAEPIKDEWITGVARLRVPYLGYVRLIATGQAEFGDVLSMTLPIEPVHAAEGEHEREYRTPLVRSIGFERTGPVGYERTGPVGYGIVRSDIDETTGFVSEGMAGSYGIAATTRSAKTSPTTDCDMRAPSASA